MLKLETKADLQRLVDDDIPESLTLDYKASPALAKDGSSRNELCKDVSAFANSAGGQIVYGIVEKKHDKPASLDEGSDIPREWIEQIIGLNIQPRIGGIVITPIDAGNGRNAFVITIPASSTAHQAPDKKYYRRFNFESVPMHDYEIRDVMKRSTTSELAVILTIANNNRTRLNFPSNQEVSQPVTLKVLLANNSPQPAYHSIVYVGLSNELSSMASVGFIQSVPPRGHADEDKTWHMRRYSSPPDQPIFQEADPALQPYGINFSISSRYIRSSYFDITTIVQTPGFTATDYWTIACNSAQLILYGPNHPDWMPKK